MADKISVQSLIITEFRKFRDCQVNFDKPITLITGQNGTAKSTLLGMLAQPFSFDSKNDNSAYISNYHDLDLSSFLDIAGNFYTYSCDKIFRLSKKHDTPDKRYLYEIKLAGIDFDENPLLKEKKLLTVQQTRGGKLRFVTGPALQDSVSISHNLGEGNFPHPVIYLSLGRLLPLAELKSCEISEGHDKLDSEEAKWYSDSYKDIFSIIDEDPESGLMNTTEKKCSVVPLTSVYDGESCSAGQDNVGRILTALLSFRRLKVKLGDKYRGGLLLIDEVDATLHPASQIKLMELLRRENADLCLQIVVTTHSMYLIDYCSTIMRYSAGVVFIREIDGHLEINSNATIEDIKLDLKNMALPLPKSERPEKISVLLEDGEAVLFFKYLLNKDKNLKSQLTIANIDGKKVSNLSGQYLEIFANNAKKIHELQNLIFVPDGDMKWAEKTKNKKVVKLPGSKSIERQIYDMLLKKKEADSFWKKCKGRNYTKRVAIGNYAGMNVSDIDAVKNWYGKQKEYWGRGLCIVFNEYYKSNQKECDAFLDTLRNIVDQCLRG